MIKNYISSLLVVLLAGAQMVQAQESMDDVFAQLEAAETGGPIAATPSAPVATPTEANRAATPAVAGGAPAEAVSQAPTGLNADVLSLLFKKGLAQYKAGKYQSAITAFDAMLAIDKYNKKAVDYRRRASLRISAEELKKQDGSRMQAMADVESAWNAEPKVLAKVDASESGSVDPAQAAIQRMEARLKAITIPNLDFRDASIEDVVLFLAEASRRIDPTGGDVDFLLVGMEYATGDTSVTISIADMSLYDALQFIVEMASLKFEVKPSMVAIMPVNYVPLSDMAMTSYNIIPEVGAELESSSGGDGGGAEDLFGDSSSNDSSTGPVDVAGFFSVVEFPEGASAVYQPRFKKLFVKNTAKNTKAIESILADLDEEAVARRSQQVEIETKFVEFNEGALEELGFDWNIYGGGSVASLQLDPRNTRLAGANTINPDPITGQSIINDNLNRPGQNLFGGSQRNNGKVGGGGIGGAFEAIQSGLLSTMGGTPASMLLGNEEIDLKITAMEQEGTADVLSAPRVTTKSGNEALIRIAETHRYPQDYDVETGQRTAPVVKPQDWEDFDLGVSLKVTPVVDPDSNTIDLELEPEIMKFKGFDEYRVGFNAFDGGGNNTSAPGGTGEALLARMPFFERRTVQTQVTIDDGQTVVMGGMIDERTDTFRDQVPFLGDIPYLGRLFRSEGSRTSKKNLVIYVKATQVDARGMTHAQREAAREVASN